MAKTIITLGREYCTGGRYIAEDVANALGIKLYDKELITMAAKHSGLSEEAVAASEKRHTHSLLYSLYTMGNELPLGDQVFILQSRIIKQLAEEGPCVILGRCADEILRKAGIESLNVFIHADEIHRAVRASEITGCTNATELQRMLARRDSRRHNYYTHYTGKKWGDSHNYHLSLDSGALGYDLCVKLIVEAAKTME